MIRWLSIAVNRQLVSNQSSFHWGNLYLAACWWMLLIAMVWTEGHKGNLKINKIWIWHRDVQKCLILTHQTLMNLVLRIATQKRALGEHPIDWYALFLFVRHLLSSRRMPSMCNSWSDFVESVCDHWQRYDHQSNQVVLYSPYCQRRTKISSPCRFSVNADHRVLQMSSSDVPVEPRKRLILVPLRIT